MYMFIFLPAEQDPAASAAIVLHALGTRFHVLYLCIMSTERSVFVQCMIIMNLLLNSLSHLEVFRVHFYICYKLEHLPIELHYDIAHRGFYFHKWCLFCSHDYQGSHRLSVKKKKKGNITLIGGMRP